MDEAKLEEIRDEYWDASVEADEALLAHWASERGYQLIFYILRLKVENERLREELGQLRVKGARADDC